MTPGIEQIRADADELSYKWQERIDALLAAIDGLTAEKAELKQKADGWIAQAEIWRTGNMKIVDKLRQSTSSYEDRIDELERAAQYFRNLALEHRCEYGCEVHSPCDPGYMNGVKS